MNDLKEKINSVLPWYECELPFSKNKVLFTPFRVKDAKNISIILQENNSSLAIKSLIDVLKNNTDLKDIENLCLADAEYLFLQIRSKSVEEQLNLIVGGKPIKVNINDVKFKNGLIKNQLIECGKLQLYITTPTLKKLLNVDVNDNISYMKSVIESISFKNEVYDLEKFVSKEVKELVDNLPLSFLNEIEKIKHPELYMNLLEEGKEVEVSGRLTFFTFR
jgi:hypothetical protein